MEEAKVTKVGVDAAITPTSKETKIKAKMGDTITITPKVGVTTTITGEEMGATVKTGLARIDDVETKRSPITTLGRGDRRLHHSMDTSKIRESGGVVETPSLWAPPKHTTNYGEIM